MVSLPMSQPCPIDKRSDSNDKSEGSSLKAWRTFEQRIAQQMFSDKQTGRTTK
jgi:hypothetical protein